MAKIHPLTPQNPRMFRAQVVRTERASPSMHRLTATGPELAEFAWLGYDHWFRLFLQLPHQSSLRLPEFSVPMVAAVPGHSRRGTTPLRELHGG